MFSPESAGPGPATVATSKAIQAFQGTRPWLLLLAVLTTLGSLVSVLGGLIYLLLPTLHKPALAIIELVLAAGEAAFAILFYRFAAAILRLRDVGPEKAAIEFERVCRRQLSLWAAIGIAAVLILLVSAIDLVTFATQMR